MGGPPPAPPPGHLPPRPPNSLTLRPDHETWPKPPAETQVGCMSFVGILTNPAILAQLRDPRVSPRDTAPPNLGLDGLSTGNHRHASPIWVAPDRATPPHSAASRGIAARARSPCGALQTARMVTARADGAPVPDRPEVAMQHHNRIAPIILGVWPSWAQAARAPTRPKACPSRRQHHHAQPQRCASSCPAPAGLYRRPPYGAALCHRATAM